MMNRESGLLLVALLFFSFCRAGFSADKAPIKSSAASSARASQPSSAKKTTKLLKYRGKVSAMNFRGGTLSINGAAGEKRFVVQDAAKDAVERLAVGDHVRVTYTEKSGRFVASSVRRVKATKAGTRQTSTKKGNLPEPAKAAK
jgi:hypothetical protein